MRTPIIDRLAAARRRIQRFVSGQKSNSKQDPEKAILKEKLRHQEESSSQKIENAKLTTIVALKVPDALALLDTNRQKSPVPRASHPAPTPASAPGAVRAWGEQLAQKNAIDTMRVFRKTGKLRAAVDPKARDPRETNFPAQAQNSLARVTPASPDGEARSPGPLDELIKTTRAKQATGAAEPVEEGDAPTEGPVKPRKKSIETPDSSSNAG